MKTTLILGSGVSYYSGIPGIGAITDSILTAENIGKHTDLNYYFEGYLGYTKQNYLQHHLTTCQNLIRLIIENIDNFYTHINFVHQTNYEDIYYVLRQINDSYYLEYENPALIKLIEFLLNETKFNLTNFKEAIQESIRFIESVVWQSIDKSELISNQYDIISDLIKHFGLDTILSLNHDLVLENWFDSNNIKYDDGFHYDNKKLPEWKGFNNNKDEIKLCKVHGSIDWFDFRIVKPHTYDNLVKVPRNHYPELTNQIDDSFKAPNGGRPALLIGTFNKMLGYLSGIHELLFEELKSAIKSSELIIIAGYAFADKGINTRLTNWLIHDNAKKMILIHPNKNNLINKSRGSFKINIMTKKEKHPKVELIEKKFEEIEIEEIKKYCA
jgi:hypothetical protein